MPGEQVLAACACDTTATLAQLGRFDLVTLFLTGIGVLLVLGGVFAFIDLKRTAKATAKATAIEEARSIAEKVTNDYLQRELPDLIEAYRAFLDDEDVSDDAANQLAEAQEDDL